MDAKRAFAALRAVCTTDAPGGVIFQHSRGCHDDQYFPRIDQV